MTFVEPAMPIRMRCHCGKEMMTQDKYIGRRVRCPGCTKLLLVPNPYGDEEAEMPLSAYAESTPLDIPENPVFRDDTGGASSSRLQNRAAEDEIRSAGGSVDEPKRSEPVADSPLPRLEIPNEPDVPVMEPEQLDDDELFEDEEVGQTVDGEEIVETEAADEEEIVETEIAESVTSQPPPLPGSVPVAQPGAPPPLPNQDFPNEDETDQTEDAWTGHADVSVGKSQGTTRRHTKTKPGELAKPERMMRVHWGLGLLLAMTFAWMMVMLLTVVFSLIGGFSIRTPAAGRGYIIILTLIRVGGWQVTSGLGLAGCLMCCWSTPKSNVKTFALMASAFLGAGMVFNFIALVAILVSGSVGAALVGLICEFLASVLGLVGVIVMLTFLRRLAKYLGDQGSLDEAHHLITAWPLVYYFIPILIISFALVLARVSGFLTFVFLIAAVIAWLSYWVKVLMRVINLIGTLRQIIEYRYQ